MAGGAGSAGTDNGGTGGTDFDTTVGGDGDPGSSGGGGGGGGAGSVGGSGGTGGEGAAGGAGGLAKGNTASRDGVEGSSDAGGGGGGGGGGAHGFVGAVLPTTAATGGAGGAGGAGADLDGGGGGAGGYGAVVNGAAGLGSLTVNVTAGKGGNGGAGTSDGGNGGTGGIGLRVDSATFTNSATITGGQGGAAGTGGSLPGTFGLGGAGIVGANLAVTNSGTIAGGVSGDGTSVQADAIDFTGGTNRLTITSTSTITGNVVAQGTASTDRQTFGLGGDTDAAGGNTFDLSQLGDVGSTAQYQGFDTLDKSGTSTWTLSGDPETTDPLAYIVEAGTLDLGNTTQTADGLSLTGGTLSGGTLSSAADFAVQAGTVSAVLDGEGALVKTTDGIVTLSADNTYSGGTSVQAGRLVESDTGNALGTGDVSISLGAVLELNISGSNTFFQHGATYTGAGTIQKTGTGTVALGNNNGPVTFSLAQGSLIDVAQGTLVGSTSDGGFFTGNEAGLTVADGAQFQGVEGDIIVDGLNGAGTLTGGYDGRGSTTIGVAGGNGYFSGKIADANVSAGGILTLIKTGTGTQTLSGQNTYTGTTTVSEGTLLVDGSTSAQSAVTVDATLGGTGTVAGTVDVTNGGTLSAGDGTPDTGPSYGTLSTGALTMAVGSNFHAEIAGTPAADRDQVDVTGSVELGDGPTGGANLNLSFASGFTSQRGAVYDLLLNDGTDAVQGEFSYDGKALGQGATFTADGDRTFQISYTANLDGGTTGNDITITDVTAPTPSPPEPPPTPPTLSISGTYATTDSAEQTVRPFTDVAVSNSDGNAPTTVTIARSGAGGTLSGTGLVDLQDGTYTVSGDRDTVVSELRGLTFTPTNGTPGAQVSTTFALTASSGGGTSNTDTATTVVDTAVPNRAATPTNDADYLITGSGPSQVVALMGNDSVVGGAGSDTFYGGMGADALLGQKGDDLLLGNRGDDVLFGGMGNDTLYGGKGNDILIGGKGDDYLSGDLGDDTFTFNPGDTDFRSMLGTGDTIGGFGNGSDKIDFTAGPVGTADDFRSASTTSTDFAQIQALAQTLLSGAVSYAFVADGADGFLFTNGGNGGSTPTDAVKLAGADAVTSLQYGDITHHPVV